MRVLTIASGGSDPNGALLSAVHTAHALSRLGHEVSVLAPQDSFVARSIDSSLAQVITSPLSRWPLTEIHRIGRWCREHQIDVLHTHCSRASAFGVMLRRLYSIPVVATAHATKIQLHWFLNDQVIAVSEATRRFHMRFNLVAPRKITTVLNPVDTERFRPVNLATKAALRAELGLASNAVLLGIVGNVIPRKGHADAIKALAGLVTQYPAAKLLIIGRGCQAEIERLTMLADQLGVANSIIWLGHRDDIAPLIGSLDVLLAPSLEEPFGLIAPEALSCEVPVVASRLGGFLTTIQDNQTGYLVKARSPHSLAEATAKLIDVPEKRRQFGQAGRLWVKQHLAPNAHFAAVEAVLFKAAAMTGHRRMPAKQAA